MVKFVRDKCSVCDVEFHPMTVYEKAGILRSFCQVTVVTGEHGSLLDFKLYGCNKQAEADGWKFRRDLTPARQRNAN